MTTTNDRPIFCPDGSTRFTNQDERDEARRVWLEAKGRDAANDVLRETLARLRVDL